MTGERDIYGVFVPSLGIWMFVAYLLSAVLRRFFASIHLYAVVWHKALFDFSIYVIALGGVVFSATRLLR